MKINARNKDTLINKLKLDCMKNLIPLLFFILSVSAFSQNQKQSPPPPPPPAAVPSEENKQFIDELITKTEMERCFREYCNLKVMTKGGKLKWTDEKMKQVNSLFKFQDIKHTIYNYFAPLTKEQLKETIRLFDLLKKDNKIPLPSFFMTTPGIMNNLDNYIDRILENNN
jgi:hypothetical protein